MKQRLSRLLAHILAYLPSKLPVGAKEFDAWADSVLQVSGRFADEDSMRFALATMIIHADAKCSSLPKIYFVRRLRKGAANQVASQVFQDIKFKQSQPKAEATATESVASDVKKD